MHSLVTVHNHFLHWSGNSDTLSRLNQYFHRNTGTACAHATNLDWHERLSQRLFSFNKFIFKLKAIACTHCDTEKEKKWPSGQLTALFWRLPFCYARPPHSAGPALSCDSTLVGRPVPLATRAPPTIKSASDRAASFSRNQSEQKSPIYSQGNLRETQEESHCERREPFPSAPHS